MPLPPLQNFVSGTPPAIGAPWLNSIDQMFVNGLGGNTTLAGIQSILGITALQNQVNSLGLISGVYTYQQVKQIFPSPLGNPTVVTVDVGEVWWNGFSWIIQGPFTIAQGGVPIIRPSSYTMGNNGAITLNTALWTTLPNCYMSFDSGGLYTGSRPGIYFCQMTNTTTGVVYPAYQYVSGNTEIPANPVASVFTGIGAFSPAVGTPVDLAVGVIPASSMGLNGRVEAKYQWGYSSSANSKTVALFLAGSTVNGSDTQTTSANPWRTTFHSVTNQGTTGSQIAVAGAGSDYGTPSIGTASNFNILSPAQDTTKSLRMCINTNIANVADYIVLHDFTIQVYPSQSGDAQIQPFLTPASALIVPPGAAANGCNVCQAFQAMSADIVAGWSGGTFNNIPGSALYTGLWYQSQPAFSTALLSNATINGVKQLAMAAGASVATQTQNTTPSLSGYIDASKSFYVESAITLSGNNADNFPAFWALPMEHRTVGDVTGYVELDIFEGGFNLNASNYPQIAAETTIKWTGGPSFTNTNYSSSAGESTLGPALDFTKEHIFGCSYNATTGIVSYYIDGVLNYTTNTTTLGFKSLINNFHYYLIWDTSNHGASLPYTMYVRYFSIWHP